MCPTFWKVTRILSSFQRYTSIQNIFQKKKTLINTLSNFIPVLFANNHVLLTLGIMKSICVDAQKTLVSFSFNYYLLYNPYKIISFNLKLYSHLGEIFEKFSL